MQRAGPGVQPQAVPQSYGGPVQAGPAGPQPVQQMQPGAPQQPTPQPLQAAPSAPAPGDDPQTANLRRAAGVLEKVRASGRLTPEGDKAYEAKLQSIYKQIEQRSGPTNEMKNFQQSQADPRFDQRSQDNAAAEAWAKGDAENRVKQYQGVVAAGVKGLQEIPQLRMLQNEMEKPNFYSGVGERYNYLFKQLKSAVGIDPNASVPQDLLRKAAASNIISSFGIQWARSNPSCRNQADTGRQQRAGNIGAGEQVSGRDSNPRPSAQCRDCGHGAGVQRRAP